MTSTDDLSSAAAAHRLDAFRQQLRAQGLSGFYVPLTDEHMSEYVGDYAQRLRWLTGFSGSAGSAVILLDKAAMFTDGRYTLQVRAEVDGALYAFESVPESSPAQWLQANVGEGETIGYDPWLATRGWAQAAREQLAAKGAMLAAVRTNPLDAIWPDQPPPSLAQIEPHDDSLAGETSAAKRSRLALKLREAGADVAIIAALDSIAWLFNIRGRDVAHTPVPRGFALLWADGAAELFVEPEKLSAPLLAHLGGDVTARPRTAFADRLAGLSEARVWLDPDFTVSAIYDALDAAGATILEKRDPCSLPKAIKNAAELEGARAAHVRDGAALSRFLHWLSGAAADGDLDELSAEQALHGFRRETNQLLDLSFPAITGSGPNGAIVHYRSTPRTNRKLRPGELFLIDSGGQYADGTTDVTRTVAVGPAGGEERDRFTRVLKGHIALASARFPRGTGGQQLDPLARMPLWAAGLDYDHGTGHGVGSYLAVHEGPQRIAKTASMLPLEPGMILSNEPGYYKTGHYGIRIENLVVVREAPDEGDERQMLGFETLTLAPIDRALIEVDLLSDNERDWLNAYHARVRETLSPLVPNDARAWLEQATAPL